MGVRAAQVAVERQTHGLGRGAGAGERHAEDGVGAEVALVGRAVRGDEGRVDAALVRGVHAENRVGALVVDVGDGLERALATVDGLVTVAQLNGLDLAGSGAGRHDGTAHAAVVEGDLDLNGGVAARIEYLAAVDVDDFAHMCYLLTGGGRPPLFSL